MSEPVYVTLEFTPNPHTLKYSVNRQLVTRGPAVNALNLEEAQERSSLAESLFEVPGISAVMLGKDFVTVTKSEEGDWESVHHASAKTIEAYLKSNQPILKEEFLKKSALSPLSKGQNSEVEKKIQAILDEEIRPAVAMDGGDIVFERYEDGIVYVYLQGSCSHCPSATATLKMGVEARLKEAVPEIIEVVAV